MLSITTGPSLFGSSTCTGQRQKQNQTACTTAKIQPMKLRKMLKTRWMASWVGVPHS